MNYRDYFRAGGANVVAVASVPPPPARPTELRGGRYSDLAEIMAIEKAGFPTPLSESRMREVLRTPATVCTVAEQSGHVVGFAVHQYGERTVRLLAVAVAPSSRRTGVGRALVDRVKRSLAIGRWGRLDTLCDERAVTALLFLRANGFRAVPDINGRYCDEHELIRFRHEVGAVDCGDERSGV